MEATITVDWPALTSISAPDVTPFTVAERDLR
jgi:hypothetical protein